MSCIFLIMMFRALRSPTSSLFSALGAIAPLLALIHMLTALLRLGVTPISTLSEWTDVLHLSTKWDFQHLRTAAITAIRPLASAVDKLVLGRAYGFTDWVPSAYTDLLARTDDLTVAEARRMDIEDVVAIAQGRREARTQSVRPMKEIEEIARTLSSGPTEAAAPAQAPTTQDKEADRAKMSPWVGDLSSSFAQESLVRFMQEDRRRVPLALDMILESGLEQTTRDVDDHVITDGSYRFYLNLMHARDTSLQLVGSPEVEDACLRLVNHWQAFSLKHIDLTLSMHDLVNTSSWNSTVRAVQYLAYLCRPYSTESHLGCVVSPSIFSGFWDTLTALHREVPFEDQLTLALCMHTLMESVGRLAFSTYVRVENDTFYSVVEKMRAEVGNMAGSIYGRDLYQALKVRHRHFSFERH
jgi:hypothetical protein